MKRHVQVKERQRGYDEASLVESWVVLNAAGGECVDDFQRLREDAGLEELIGKWVYRRVALKPPEGIPYMKIGKYLRFRESDLREYVERLRRN